MECSLGELFRSLTHSGTEGKLQWHSESKLEDIYFDEFEILFGLRYVLRKEKKKKGL